jgi:lipoprotein-anchoring transpeptidase ErfK/SrfK
MLAQLAVVGLLAASAAGSLAAAPSSASQVQATQETAVLTTRHAALAAPRRGSAPLRMISARRPITNEQTVLPVTGHAVDARGRAWLRVRLPGRPNGGIGWIERAGTRKRVTAVHLVVDISQRRVTVYRHGHEIRRFRAIVGRPSTPTPRGEFFVEEAIALPASATGAPYALALSARSDVYQEFDGGPGQVAIHGLGHLSGSLGTAVSHGCVRLTAAAMSWLVILVGPGVPVTVRS